eukprot:Rhum_TRINITY_DN6363_c0_g1::Rhum_TRINITY_DN6363_c0_g1_i1::g.19828::m.19828
MASWEGSPGRGGGAAISMGFSSAATPAATPPSPQPPPPPPTNPGSPEAAQLQDTEALLQKWEEHEGSWQEAVREARAEATKLRRLLKIVMLKAGGALGMDDVVRSVGEGGLLVDPRPDIDGEAVVRAAEAEAAPRAGTGKWFEAQMRIRALETAADEQRAAAAAAREGEQLAAAAARAGEAGARAAAEEAAALRAQLAA